MNEKRRSVTKERNDNTHQIYSIILYSISILLKYT